MYRTRITKKETCLSYAVRRVYGKDITCGAALCNASHFFTTADFSKEEVRVGDIVLWDKKAFTREIPTEIDEEGELVLEEVAMNRHCGVVEKIGDEIIISECLPHSDKYNTPHLVVKNIRQFKREPDKILRR